MFHQKCAGKRKYRVDIATFLDNGLLPPFDRNFFLSLIIIIIIISLFKVDFLTVISLDKLFTPTR